MSKKSKIARAVPAVDIPVLTSGEFAALGTGKVGYIRMLSYRQAREMFPGVQGLEQLPDGVDLFALHSADGTPLALTDSHDAAIGHALEDELEVASLH